MLFYIVTPTFNALSWLKRCIRSVADQVSEGVEIIHHVQDGGSTDGTPEWLAAWQAEHEGTPGYRFRYVSVRDRGMYDAINLAWAAMPEGADVTAHLNSDEQYLPGALSAVAQAMAARQEADIALGTYVILDAKDRYICHRRPVLPHVWSSRTVCEIITCSCFHRVPAFLKHGIRFDTRYRALADLVLYRDITATRPRFLMLPDLVTSSFAVTGGNLAWSETGMKEWRDYLANQPWYASCSQGFVRRWVNFKRRLVNLRCQIPSDYSIYGEGETERTPHAIKHPTCIWGLRTEGEE